MTVLDESKAYKPFAYPWAVELTKKHEEVHWVEDEAELSEDVQDWRTKLSVQEKDFIENILRLFTQSDVQVGSNYHEFLIPKMKNNEVRNMLASFANREGVHQRAYALLNDTLGLPEEDFHKFIEYKEMADKLDFMADSNINSLSGLALALAQSVFNEGMSLFASFVMLLNFQRFGKMKGMGTIVHIADRRLLQLGLKAKFKAKENPLPWLDWVLNGVSHDNFFEKRVTEYSVAGMEGDWGWESVAA